jgi:ATP-dependent Clp protease adapter protein ClpS
MSQHHADRDSAPRSPSGTPTPATHPQRRLPLYKVVLLHNAAVDLMFVVRTVMELTRLCRAEATHKMWQAHHSGKSILLITYRERAELYVEQFAEKGLATTLEPA